MRTKGFVYLDILIYVDGYGMHLQYMGVLSILLLLLLVYLQQPVDYSNSVTIYIRSVYVYTHIMYYCL